MILMVCGLVLMAIGLLGVGLILLSAFSRDDRPSTPEPAEPMHHWLDPRNRA